MTKKNTQKSSTQLQFLPPKKLGFDYMGQPCSTIQLLEKQDFPGTNDILRNSQNCELCSSSLDSLIECTKTALNDFIELKELFDNSLYSSMDSDDLSKHINRILLKQKQIEDSMLDFIFAASSNPADEFIAANQTYRGGSHSQTQQSIPSNISVKIIHSTLTVIRIPKLPLKYFGTDTIADFTLSSVLARCPDFPKWKKWNADFVLIYPTTLRVMPKDIDAYDYKKIIDIIAFAMETSDNAFSFSRSQTVYLTDKIPMGCYILISKKSSDCTDNEEWINKWINTPEQEIT